MELRTNDSYTESGSPSVEGASETQENSPGKNPQPEITAAHWAVAEAAARDHGEMLKAKLLRFTEGDEDLTHNVLQTAYFKLARACARGQFDPENTANNVPGWLMTVTRRLIINARLSEQVAIRRFGLPVLDDPSVYLEKRLVESSPEDSILGRLNASLAFAALQGTIDPFSLSAFIACDVEGISVADYAEFIDAPTGTIGSRRSRARKKIGQLLKNNPELLELFGGPAALEGRVKK